MIAYAVWQAINNHLRTDTVKWNLAVSLKQNIAMVGNGVHAI